jgi:uncharacterized protein YecE (DUF72 family)
MTFSLGCAVWAFKGWVGDFYPPKSRPTDFLSLYSQRFNTVEGNATFYVVPDREVLKRWVAETPQGFEFCLKLPRELTHNGLLKSSIPGSIRFFEHVQTLGDRLGITFAQLPPSYSPDAIADLTEFLTTWATTKAPLALEVRHPDWFSEPHQSKLNDLLQQLGIGRVLLDSRPVYEADDDPQINSARRKPRLPLQISLTANFALVRFISHPRLDLNEVFLQEWVHQIDLWLQQGIQVYFFVHCPTEERSPHNARHFQHLLESHAINVPALPWSSLEAPPTQLSLFG